MQQKAITLDPGEPRVWPGEPWHKDAGSHAVLREELGDPPSHHLVQNFPEEIVHVGVAPIAVVGPPKSKFSGVKVRRLR